MTKRIFHSICLASIIVFLASMFLFMGALYHYFTGLQQKQLRIETELASKGVSAQGGQYFHELADGDYRITWIASNGTVLYDSKYDSSKMENHLRRAEVAQALADGTGESSRYSMTLTERSLYCAKLLPDGTILRLSTTHHTLFALILGMVQPICLIFLAAVLLSLILAFRLSRKITKPLNNLDLDAPQKNDVYEELNPLLYRISSQQRRIKRQSSELEQKQNEFLAISRGMTEGIMLLNGKQVILSLNPAAEHLLGIRKPCKGKHISTVNRNLQLQSLLQTAAGGQYSETILEIGNDRYQFRASPIFSDGQVAGTVLLILDVTEKEKLEQIRREFTANVSHELKTPLHTISGCAELLSNGIVQTEDVESFSLQIYSEAQRMIHLVEDIIRLSHLDEGTGDWKRETTDLYLLAEETVQALDAEAKEAGVALTLKGEKASIYGIPQLLLSILHNLCDNAIKYNRKGGFVTVTIKNEAENIRLTVSDTGIGIPAEHQERIFERFYRVDKSHSKEIGGTGLGLSIVKHAVRLHNGVLHLKSNVGEGTDITVIFPRNP